MLSRLCVCLSCPVLSSFLFIYFTGARADGARLSVLGQPSRPCAEDPDGDPGAGFSSSCLRSRSVHFLLYIFASDARWPRVSCLVSSYVCRCVVGFDRVLCMYDTAFALRLLGEPSVRCSRLLLCGFVGLTTQMSFVELLYVCLCDNRLRSEG